MSPLHLSLDEDASPGQDWQVPSNSLNKEDRGGLLVGLGGGNEESPPN